MDLPLYFNWSRDIMLGALSGGIYGFLATAVSALAFGFPLVTSLTMFSIVLVGLISPIAEEFIFRIVLQRTLDATLKNFIPAMLVQSAVFALYHYFAYGSVLSSMATGFVGAFIFAIFSTLLCYKTRSILPSIICHSMINLILLRTMFLSIGGV